MEDFEVDITSPTSVDISWNPPPRVNWNGRIESYNIISERGSVANRKRRETTETISVSPQANHGDPSLASEPLKTETYKLENLEENFQYHFSISITNSAKGASVPTDPIIQTMPESGRRSIACSNTYMILSAILFLFSSIRSSYQYNSS